MIPVLRPLALVACLAALPALAQEDTREARIAVAREHVEASMADMGVERIVEQMWRAAKPQFEQMTGKPLTEAQETALQTLYMAQFADPMQTIMGEQADIMADLMTLNEITALRDFYQTPTGRSVMMKLPDLIAAQQPAIMDMVQQKLPVVMPQIMQILQGE